MHLRIYNARERGAIYTRLTGYKVYFFTSDTVEILGAGTVEGRAELSDAGYQIGLRQGLPLADELATLAHELAHIQLGHVFKVSTQAEQTQSDLIAAQILKGGRTSAERNAYAERERQADDLAARILREWHAQGITV